MSVYDVIVLGVGGVGSAALSQLARRGVRALGIDRFPPGHDRGSSHGETRIIRQAYFEHPDYVPLVKRAYTLWNELESRCGQTLYHETGLLQVGPEDGHVVSGVLNSAARHGLSVERLSPSEAARRFPGFRIPERMTSVFEARAGYLRVEDCVRAYATDAQTSGAELRTGESVREWSATENGVTVRTDAGTYFARNLIVTAGAWAGQLLGDLGVPLEVVRKSLYWFEADAPHYREERGGPAFLFETPEGEFYGFPEIDSQGVKTAEHTGGLPVRDPLAVNRSEDVGETVRLRAFLTEYVPFVSNRRTRFTTCLYTLSPDRHFLVDRHPRHRNVAFAAGLSGHGFKFASVLGEVLADWATMGQTQQPVEFLSPKRFLSLTSEFARDTT
jgi:sarcosine oxidase